MNSIKAIVLAAALGAASTSAFAERYVVVNGQRLSDPEILQVEAVHCGPIANGSYWVDVNTLVWGYAGNPRPQGRVNDNCYQPGPRPGLSQRGELYTPWDWVR